MKKMRVNWEGVATSIKVQKAERVNERIWILTATVTGAPFRIEKETGQLIREVAKGSDLARFILTKPAGQQNWLLGRGSFIRGVG